MEIPDLEHVREKHAADFISLESLVEIERMRQSLARTTRVVQG